MDPIYSVVIPTYNKFKEALLPCLNSLVENVDLATTEIIVVANGCTDETERHVDLLHRLQKNIRLVSFPEAIGYTRAGNEGIKAARGEYIVMLNNDTQVLTEQGGKHWLDILKQPFLSDETVGITGPMKEHCLYADRDFLLFFCVMIHRKVIEKIGLMDEVFSPGYGEDTDFCCRAVDAGFKIVQVPDDGDYKFYGENRRTGNFPLYHEGNVTFKNWNGGEQLLERNRGLLKLKYANTSPKAPQVSTPCTSCVNIERALNCDGFMSPTELKWLAGEAKKAKLFIEIGSWHGRSSRAIADNLAEGSKLICVDTWKGSIIEQDTNHASAKLNDGDHAFIEFCENMFDHIQSGKVIPLRMTGNNAADLLRKEGVYADVIFIDAGHTYEEVKEDIFKWIHLIKEGGVLCGHDYYHLGPWPDVWPGVREAVDELFGHKGTNMGWIQDNSIWRHVITQEVGYKVFDVIVKGKTDAAQSWIEGIEKSMPNHGEEAARLIMSGSPTLDGKQRPNVYDCFPFNRELDLLERRFEELYNVVDRFVVVEATKTHGGKDKPSYFLENMQRFQKYLNKVTHILVDDYPSVPNEASITDKSWAIERHQRDCIMRGLTQCKDDDIIIITDADEIPYAEAILSYVNRIKSGIRSLEMDLYYYDENTKSPDVWFEGKILTYRELKELGPCGARYSTLAPRLQNAGKHLSYQGGVEEIVKKLEDTAHQELNTDEFKNRERIQQAIKNRADLFGRDYVKFDKVS